MIITPALHRRWLPALAIVLAGFAPAPASGPVEPRLLSGLVWRNIGPFRAGRVTAVGGAIGQPGVFYMGLPVGGVWKTTSAGVTWFPVFDDIKDVASIGAVEVAPSNPNVVYVGTGSTNDGDGMYKSIDAGRTWQHLGMDSTRRISYLLVDPRNPDVVLMAAMGSARIADGNRGVFRSTDGGRTWTRTLYVDSATGVPSFAWAYDHPEVILATTRRALGFGGGGGGGGGAAAAAANASTKVFKSTDQGVTWTEITGGGLPALSGRLSVAVAMHTDARRMYLIGPTAIGLWRSDDGGATWRRMSAGDPRVANGQGNYSSGVWVNTGNPDIVYTTATTVYRSTNGGNTFTGFKGAPGGDDPQVLWLDPNDPQRMLLGTDQGATVTQDAGDTWSLWYNQATDQIYHISVDNSYPYWIYGTQQDACAIATRSRGDLGQITPIDWLPNPGFERGSIVADPLNPKIIFALNMTAGIMKITYPSGQWINVAPNIDSTLALRSNGDQPLIFNAANPRELLAGYQYLMATTDAGMHWRKLGADLGVAPEGVAPAPAAGGGGGGGGAGGTISAISTSSVAPGVIWVGTTNGNIQVTRDHGTTWTNVSIPGYRGAVGSVDASHLDAGAAYVAMRQAGTEFAPSFYRTHDYGRTWTKIIRGMATDQPNGSWARVIRADTKAAGLLFAGTESSMYVSFDDGDHWQSLMLNLPTSSYRDIVVKDNDLVVATYGRSIWILDDISPLRQMTENTASETAYLFKPGDAIRVRRDVNGDTPFPPEVPRALNPPLGAVIYYWLGRRPPTDITLEIRDASGDVVRHMSSAAIPPLPDAPPPVPDFWLEVPKPMPMEVGTNRVNWDLRYDNPPAFNHNYAQVMGGVPYQTQYTPQGPLALPGVYTVVLTVEGNRYTQTVTVHNDPRSPASMADLQAQHALQMKLYAGAMLTWDAWHQVAAMRAAVADAVRGSPPAEVTTAATAFDATLSRLAGNTAVANPPARGTPGQAPNFANLNGTEPGESYVLLSMNGQLRTTDYGDMAPTEAMLRASQTACLDLKTAMTAWHAINANDLVAFNAVLSRNSLRPVPAAEPALPIPACVPVAPAARPAAR